METQPKTTTLSTEESTNLVKQSYDAYFQQDMERLMSLYSEDIDWKIYGPEALPTAGSQQGKSQVMEFFERVDELLENDRFEVHQYVAQGNTVVALGEYTWRSKVTGRTMDAPFAHVITIRDGKIVKFRELTDTAAALEAMTDG